MQMKTIIQDHSRAEINEYLQQYRFGYKHDFLLAFV